MRKSVVIDCLPETVRRYSSDWAVVAVDVIRATTTAVTAAVSGRRCFPVPTVEAALALARKLNHPVLAGESGGTMPAAFEMNNSPADLVLRTDRHRPLVLVSTSGTKLIHHAADGRAVYLACFRNYSAVADHLAGRHPRVAVIGAGRRDEFREEDQMCCAWIAARLMARGYQPGNPETGELVRRWENAPPKACLMSRSVDYLLRSGQLKDLDFILNHIDDLRCVFAVEAGEVRMIQTEPASSSIAMGLNESPAVPIQA